MQTPLKFDRSGALIAKNAKHIAGGSTAISARVWQVAR